MAQKASQEFYVRLDRSVSVERLAEAVAPMGKIASRDTGSTIYLIQLKPGIEDDQAKRRLGCIRGVHPLTADQEPVNFSSVRSLDRKIAHLKSEEADKAEKEGKNDKSKENPKVGKKGEGPGEKDEDEKVDYLRARRYFVQRRAFPNDSVDWSALDQGQKHAAAMPPAYLANRKPGVFGPNTAQWTFLGPTNLPAPYNPYYGIGDVNGRVNAVAFDPTNSQIIYAGAAQGGIFKSTDGGQTWSWLSSSWTQLGVNCITIDPTNGTIYVGRGDFHGGIVGSYGIMKSTDGGATWSEIAESSMGNVGVNKILVDPTNSQTLIAGTGDWATSVGTGSIWRSTDGGQTWSKNAVGGQYFVWPTFAATVPNGTTVRFYAVAGGYANGGGQTSRLYKSDDHGATWQLTTSPVPADGNYYWAYEVATSPTNANNVYVLDSQNQALYTSTTAGTSWTNQSGNLPTGNEVGTNYNFSQSFYDYHLECGTWVQGASKSDVLFLGEIDIQESTDGGNTWTSIGGPTYNQNGGAIAHNDQHCLAVCPTNPNLAVFSNDGGVYTVTFDSSFTPTVNDLNQYLQATMFYHIAMHPTNPNILLGGAQDNATPVSTGSLANWTDQGGGDGGGVAINQTNPLIQYASVYDLELFDVNDGWAGGTPNPFAYWGNPFYGSDGPGGGNNAPFVCTMTLDPSNQYLLYTGSCYLWQWNEQTQTWNGPLGNGQDLTNEQNTGVIINAIAVAPNDSNRIYTGSSDGALWMSTDQGNTWQHLNAGTTSLPSASIDSISVSPTNSSDILIGLGGAGLGKGHLWRCSNTQANQLSFTSVSGTGSTGLSDVSLNAIARDLTNPTTTWYVGMDVGVFVTTNSGSSWSNAGAPLGLPSVIVDDLVAVPGTGYLNAGTYGRGVWSLQITGGTTTSLSAFTISPSTVSAGGTSTGTVTLSGAAPSGGAVVTLSSGSTGVATVPSSVTIPAGSTSATFTINSNATLSTQSTSVLSATYSGTTLNQTITVTVVSLNSVSLSPTAVVGGNSSTGTVTLSGPAGSTGTTVTLSSSSIVATVPTSVTVPSGATTATFTVTTTAVAAQKTVSISGSLGSSTQSATLTINPPALSGVSIAPASVPGGTSSTGTVTLTGQAPAGGLLVNLKSSIGSATVPATVTVAAGSTTATFTVSTNSVSSVTNATITASLGSTSVTATLTINPAGVSSITLSPTSVPGGSPSTGTVTLTGNAPNGGTVVNLTSSSASASVPATVTVAAGSATATFTINTSAVSANVSATISAAIGSSTQSATLTITPATLLSVSVNPVSVQGGNSSTGTVTLSGPAPSAGMTVTLTSGSSVATAPATVSVAGGATAATFSVSTHGVSSNTSVTITATLGSTSKSTTLGVTAPTVTSVSLSPATIIGGSGASGTITISGPAASGGITIPLTSSTSSASVPASVTIASGATSATFNVSTSTVTSTVTATISGTFNGTTASGSLTIETPLLSALSLSPNVVIGGNSATGTITLARAAPSGGVAVVVSAGSSASAPSSVSIATGATSATFTITTTGVATATNSTISASMSGTTKTAILTVTPAAIGSLVIAPSSVGGGNSATGTITLNGLPPSTGATITLNSSSASVGVPGSVIVSGGNTSATFVVSTKAVTTSQTATVTAGYGGNTQKATVTVQPAYLASLSLTPTTVVGGSSTGVTGAVMLNGVAATTGATVSLTSSSPSAASVPASVKIQNGTSTISFKVTHHLVSTSKSVTITASYSGIKQTATLTLNPFQVVSLSFLPTSVTGGAKSSGSVLLNAQPGASGPIAVKLTSSSKSVSVPVTVSVPLNVLGAVFTATTSAVGSQTTATVTGSYGSSSAQASLTVSSPSLIAVSVSPTTVKGSASTAVTGTVSLSGIAPTGGVVVKLASSSTSSATVPVSVTIPAGKATATFKVTHFKVSSQVGVTLTATSAGVAKTTTLTVTP